MPIKNIFFFLVILFANNIYITAQNNYLVGSLIGEISGEPISNAKISSLENSTVSSDGGTFYLILPVQVQPGEKVSLFIQHENYGSHFIETLVPNNQEDSILISIKPNNKVIITGKVVDNHNKPLEGVKVEISSENIISSVIPPIGTTNAYGEFKLILHKKALIKKSDFISISVEDPNGKYGSKYEFFNISTPFKIEMHPLTSSALYNRSHKVSDYAKIDIQVLEGSLVTIEASGNIRVGTWVGTVSPEGKSAGVLGISLEGYNIVNKFPHGSLIYRIGDEAWKLCGHKCGFVSQISGILSITFEINDKNKTDNYGAYDVRISVTN